MDTASKIKGDLLKALKSGDSSQAEILRYILSAIHNAEIAKGKGKSLTEEELAQVLQKQAKQRQESIEAYKKGGRNDLAEKEKKELEIIKTYLPEQLSEEKVRQLAEEAVKKVGASGPKDIGRVMGALMPEVKGKADGAVVSKVVKGLLSGS
jgi:uncharacterized protein YqeY